MSEEMVYPGEGSNNDPKPNLGELALVDHSINPLTGEERSREEEPVTRIEDESKAEAMAGTGDFTRSKAAHERRVARYKTGIPDREWHPKEYYETPSTEGLPASLDNVFPDRKPQFAPDFHYGNRSPYEIMKEAAYLDAEASGVEDWAGILHDHPPTEAFKEQHRGFSFYPEGMNNAVTILRAAEKELGHYERRIISLEWDEIKKDGSPDGIMEKLSFAVAIESQNIRDQRPTSEDDPEYALYVKLKELANNPDTTLGALAEHLKESALKRAKEERARVEEIRSMIDDVYTGKAAEHTGEEDVETGEHSEGEPSDHS